MTEAADHINIPERDLRIDVFRSSGPGGQSVNTTDSAVRITHLPTGIVVSCQNEKSQLQNKAAALRVLQARLLERARQDREAQLNALKGDGGNAGGLRCGPTFCTRTRWSRICGPSMRSPHPRPYLMATSTASLSRASAGAGRGGRQQSRQLSCAAPRRADRARSPTSSSLAAERRACSLV